MKDLFGSDVEPVVRKAAVLSACGLYRYRLERTWDDALAPALFVMLNPSTADATVDDPTVRRCIGFARSWGCGGVVVVNLFAFRATDPAALLSAADPVGPDNFRHVIDAIEVDKPAKVVCAWGAHRLPPMGNEMVARIRMTGRELHCLGMTMAGCPRHPLYVPASADLVPFKVEVLRP